MIHFRPVFPKVGLLLLNVFGISPESGIDAFQGIAEFVFESFKIGSFSSFGRIEYSEMGQD